MVDLLDIGRSADSSNPLMDLHRARLSLQWSFSSKRFTRKRVSPHSGHIFFFLFFFFFSLFSFFFALDSFLILENDIWWWKRIVSILIFFLFFFFSCSYSFHIFDEVLEVFSSDEWSSRSEQLVEKWDALNHPRWTEGGSRSTRDHHFTDYLPDELSPISHPVR